MKYVLKFATAMVVLIAVGCGGGGNQPAPVVIAPTGTPTVEAIVKVLPTNLQHPQNWSAAQLLNPQTPGLQADLIDPTVFGIQDPTNIECSEQMVFQLVYYSPDGTRNIIPSATFVSSDTTGVYGTLAGNTGDYLAGATPTKTALTMTATANGQSYSALFDIKRDQVRIIGTVLAQGTNANQLAGTQIQFFNAAGGLVDTVTVQSDGTFRGSIPTIATAFTVVADSVPAAFYQSFQYLGLQYDAGVVSCYAPLPSGLGLGTTSLTGAVFVNPRSQPAIASTGCSNEGGKAHIIKNR